jgi:hypothetical protein
MDDEEEKKGSDTMADEICLAFLFDLPAFERDLNKIRETKQTCIREVRITNG